MQNLAFLALAFPEIWRGPKILKVGHVPFLTPFDLILHFVR